MKELIERLRTRADEIFKSNAGPFKLSSKVEDDLALLGMAASAIEKRQGELKQTQAENKQLHLQLETITKDRDYYRDAYHHLLREQSKSE